MFVYMKQRPQRGLQSPIMDGGCTYYWLFQNSKMNETSGGKKFTCIDYLLFMLFWFGFAGPVGFFMFKISLLLFTLKFN